MNQINKIKPKNKHQCFCIICGADRGFQEKSAMLKRCKKCALQAGVSEETRLKISKAKKGHKKTPEQIEKSAKYHRGKTVSEETKNKLRESFKTNKNPGGAAKGLKKSDAWHDKIIKTYANRKELSPEDYKRIIEDKNDRRFFKSSMKHYECFIRDDFTCQKCSNKGGRLNAHHMNSWKFFPEQRYSLDNLVTLCTACHKAFHATYGNGVKLANTKEQIYAFFLQ